MISRILREQEGLRRAKLETIGFGPISNLNWTYTDANLCFAVAERFWPKTSTFHFPCGEMSITLDDTARILALPVMGKALVPVACNDYLALVTRCLGRLPDNATHLELIAKGRIELKWLIGEFHTLPADATPIQADCYTRAYILALCGCCLFPNDSGRYVSLRFLTVLEDLDEGGYASGAVVLAYLYTSIKDFVLSDKYELRGCVVLLQVWAHVHFPAIGTPVVREGLEISCLAENYCGPNRKYTADPHHTLVYYRQEFDLLTANKANALEGLCERCPHADSIRRITNKLRSLDGIQQVPQEHLVAPPRGIRFHAPQVGVDPPQDPYFPEDPYFPVPPQPSNEPSSSTPYFPEPAYGESLSTQHPQTPDYMTPPPAYFEPSQDVQPSMRPQRNVHRIGTHVLMCLECTRRGNNRCPIHQ